MKTLKNIGIAIGIVALITLIFCMLPITIFVKPDNTLLYTNKISSESILNYNGNRTITLTENNEKTTYKYTELGIIPMMEKDVVEYINSHKILYINNIKVEYFYDALKEQLDRLNDARLKNKYSSLIKEDNNFIVTKEVIGNYLDIDKLYEYIVQNLGSNIEVELSDYYSEEFDKSKIRQGQLEKEIDKIENTYINYTNGYTLKLTDLADYLFIDNNKIIIKDNEETLFNTIDKLIEKELIDYDTVGNEMEFTTTNGDIIKIGGGTWGDIFSSDLETEYIIDKLYNFENEVNRTPILSQDYSNEIPNTYVEVSITDQWVWYYKDGELIMDSGCVTGTFGKNDTPHGVYYIFQKARNVTFETGGKSKTWMKFTKRGHGLHDATWRSNSHFGTDRYKKGGSHGCVNLPLKFATELYDEVDIGTCVVIY